MLTIKLMAQLGITRISVASSVNAIGLVFNKDRYFDYLPVDEAHKCCPDESYGLSKLYVFKPCCLLFAIKV
jgi:hypothetical protein